MTSTIARLGDVRESLSKGVPRGNPWSASAPLLRPIVPPRRSARNERAGKHSVSGSLDEGCSDRVSLIRRRRPSLVTWTTELKCASF